MFECCKGDQKNKLSFKELSFLTYAALIRGAIAFGLTEKLEESDDKFPKKKVIVSSVLYLVLTSTFIFGGFTAIV